MNFNFSTLPERINPTRNVNSINDEIAQNMYNQMADQEAEANSFVNLSQMQVNQPSAVSMLGLQFSPAPPVLHEFPVHTLPALPGLPVHTFHHDSLVNGGNGWGASRPTLAVEYDPTPLCIKKEPCGICYDSKMDVKCVPCNHTFCAECIMAWTRTKRTCPMCRDQIIYLKTNKKPDYCKYLEYLHLIRFAYHYIHYLQTIRDRNPDERHIQRRVNNFYELCPSIDFTGDVALTKRGYDTVRHLIQTFPRFRGLDNFDLSLPVYDEFRECMRLEFRKYQELFQLRQNPPTMFSSCVQVAVHDTHPKKLLPDSVHDGQTLQLEDRVLVLDGKHAGIYKVMPLKGVKQRELRHYVHHMFVVENGNKYGDSTFQALWDPLRFVQFSSKSSTKSSGKRKQ